jgi:predicted nucleic acid-binding Zn ribbon protein
MTSPLILQYQQFLEAKRSRPRVCKVCEAALSGRRQVFCEPCVNQRRDRETYQGVYRKPKVREARPCPRCGVVFTPGSNAQKHCTRECGSKADNERRRKRA